MTDNIKDFIKGWLVGDFEPCLFQSKDVEVGVKYYKEGDVEPKHVHKIVKEYTIVLNGEIKMKGRTYTTGSIVTMEPGESTSFESITDSIILVIKTPSIPSDKEVL